MVLDPSLIPHGNFGEEISVATSVHSSIVINRPIEDVFAVLTHVENTGKWFPPTSRSGGHRRHRTAGGPRGERG